MERLTKRSDFTGLVLIDGKGYGEAYFGAKEDFDRITKALNKLAAYEDAEEQGRLVALPEPTPDIDFMRIFNLIMADAEDRIIVLPCKVGDTLWIVSTSFNPQIVKTTVEWISAQSQKDGFSIDLYVRDEDGIAWSLTDYNIGKTVFLSREEAEAALKGEENETTDL